MNQICLVSVLVLLSAAVLANDDDTLALSPAEMERLGVELDYPSPASLIEIGSGPAEVVIPPTQQAIVGATVGGVLSRLLVAEGEAVDVGQPMAEIESPALLTLQREYVDAVAAQELVQVQLQRDRGLREDGIIAERRLQETEATARAAAVSLDQRHQQLRLAGMSQEQLTQLAEQQQLNSSLTLRSPMRGVVVSQLSALGAQVGLLDPVFRVADLTRLWLEVRVSQQQAARIQIGMQVTVPELDRELHATVFHVGPVIDPVSQTVLIRAALDNDQLRLRPGQFMSARIVSGVPGETGAFELPSRAIIRDGSESYIFVRTADGLAVRQVEILSDNGQQSYVTSAIREDSLVVISGIAVLKSIWLEGRTEKQ